MTKSNYRKEVSKVSLCFHHIKPNDMVINNKVNAFILLFSKMHYSIISQSKPSNGSFSWENSYRFNNPFITMIKYYSHLLVIHSLPTSIKPLLSSTPKVNQSCLRRDTIFYLKSLLCSIKCNTYHSQYPILLPVMVVSR